MSAQRKQDKFWLEVDDWGDWTLEEEFSELSPAQEHGRQFFPQNAWRVVNERTKDVVFVYDPLESMVETAATEVQRFNNRDRWMDRFIRDREIRAVRLQQQERQRRSPPNVPSLREEEEAFGNGSRGVWVSPSGENRGRIPTLAEVMGLPLSPRPAPRRLIDILDEEDDDGRPVREKYNWQEEGF